MMVIFIYMKYYHLFYYYSIDCQCCSGYSAIVDEVCSILRIDSTKREIGHCELSHRIEGVPSVVLEDGFGKVVFKAVGNIRKEDLLEGIKDVIE